MIRYIKKYIYIFILAAVGNNIEASTLVETSMLTIDPDNDVARLLPIVLQTNRHPERSACELGVGRGPGTFEEISRHLRENADGESFERYLTQVECRDLLANDPPKWFNRFVNLVSPPLDLPWAPVLGPVLARSVRVNFPNESYIQSSARFRRVVSRIMDTGCPEPALSQVPPTPAAAPVPQNTRPSVPPVEPLLVRSAGARTAIVERGRQAIAAATDNCCASNDAECRRYFASTEFSFCNLGQGRPCHSPTTAMSARPSYISTIGSVSPTIFHRILSLNIAITDPRILNEMTGLRHGLRRHRLDAGVVVINARMDFSQENESFLFAHEYGHLCSVYQRLTYTRQNATTDAINAWRGTTVLNSQYFGSNRQTACPMNENMIRTYARLFNQYGASTETFGCITDRIRRFPRGRFLNEASCEPICPGRQLEEYFADWMALRAARQAPDVREAILRFASSGRDDEHPHPLDEMSCFMLTGTVREKVRLATGCRYQ